MLNYYADQQIVFGNRVNEWTQIKSGISNLDLTTIDALNTLQKHAYSAQAYLTEIDSIQSITLSGVSPNSLLFSYLLNDNITSNAMWPQLLTLDLTAKLSKITIPVALYFGQYDFVIPSNVGMDYYNHLSSPKEIYIFEKSDHNLGVLNGIDLYYQKTINFIETHK